MNCEDLHRADCMLLTDHLPSNVDVIFFHARAHGDCDDLFELVANSYREYNEPFVFVNGGDGKHHNGTVPLESWEGAERWRDQLTKLHVHHKDIIVTQTAFHTKEENNYFLEAAREKKVKSALVVGQPERLTRQFLGLVKSMNDMNYWMRVYPLAPKFKATYSWWRPVYCFSAMLTPEELPSREERYRPRFDLAGNEAAKIPVFQEKGDLATFEELFSYLRRRESIS